MDDCGEEGGGMIEKECPIYNDPESECPIIGKTAEFIDGHCIRGDSKDCPWHKEEVKDEISEAR
jgi:hypothetical protein